MSKDDSEGSDGAGVAGISQNDIFVEANASNIEGNSNLLRGPTFSGSDNRNETFLPNRLGMTRKLLSQKRRLTIDLKHFIDKLRSTKKPGLTDVVSKFHEIESSYYEFKRVLEGLPYVLLLEDMSSFLTKKNLSSEDAKEWPNVLLFGIMNSENMSNHSSTKNFVKFQCKLYSLRT